MIIILVGTTSSIHFLIKHVTDSEYASYVVIRRCPEHVPVHVIKTVLKCSVRLVGLDCPEGGCFTFQFLPISRQEQNGRVIRFAERWSGEVFVCVPEGSVAMVQYTIFTRVDGDVLKVFWSYCSEVGFIKFPLNNKRHLGAWFPAHLYSRTIP